MTTDRRALLRETYAPGLRRAAVVVGVSWHAFLAVPLVIHLGAYRNLIPPVLAWCLMAATGAVLLPRIWHRPLTDVETWLACCVPTIATLLVAPMCQGLDVVGFADWPANGATWLLVLVAASRRSRDWAVAVAGPLIVQAACTMVTAGTGVTAFERLLASGYAAIIVLLMVGGIRPAFEAQADVASREATLRARITAQQDAAEAVRYDRLSRLALLQREVLPLLQDVADGAADPTDPRVRERCGAQSAALRRALVDSMAVRDALVSEIRSVLDAAGRTGVTTDLQVSGALAGTGPAVWAATRRALAAVLGGLSTQETTLTVLAGDEYVEVFLPFRAELARGTALRTAVSRLAGPDRWRATVTLDDNDPNPTGHLAGYLEIRWPKESA